ncbi:MAG: helix-turn-helix domain-containing protein [Chlorobium sp.]|nr:helix-turn-helix domain-containing protein [Chlorobium sp.]
METLWTAADVVRVTGLKLGTIRKYVRMEWIPFTRLGSAIRFRPSEVEAWVEARSHRPPEMRGRMR